MSSDTERLFSAAYIHEKIDIPYKYLTMLMTKLAKAFDHDGMSSPARLLVLSRDVDKIYLIDILNAID